VGDGRCSGHPQGVWLRANIGLDTAPTLAIHPETLTVREWLGESRIRRPGDKAEHRPSAHLRG
jgi:hypothetical protein